MGTIRVILADDHEIVRMGIATLLGAQPDIEVVAQASTGAKAVDAWLEHNPDVAVLDLQMPEGNGFDAIEDIRVNSPSARLLIITTHAGDEDVHRALELGAAGYVLKDASGETIVHAVREVAAGRRHIPADVAAILAERVSLGTITPRETAVLEQVATGKSNKEIAAELKISEGTAKAHISSILRKLDAADRTEAVTIALRRGMIRLDES